MKESDIVVSILAYGLKEGFLSPEDYIYSSNKLLHLFKMSSLEEGKTYPLEEALQAAIELGKAKSLEEMDNLNQEDCFEAEIMDQIMPRPYEVIQKFYGLLKINPCEALSYMYDFAIKTRYVRLDRLKKNVSYEVEGEKCSLDITINLSKPEKDPKEIAKGALIKSSSYPACALCKENEGFYGSFKQAGRSNIRLIPLKLNNEDFYFQYSPYGYFNEHCIVLKKEHEKMTIDEKTLRRLFDFVDLFPSYFLGSNADLPIVGGSILSHEHYQGGNYLFQLDKAKGKERFSFASFPEVEAEIVDWPISVIRAYSSSREELMAFGDKVIASWRSYSDEGNMIYAQTDGVMHNTVNPILRKNNGVYQLSLALRNNFTTEKYPLGLFHPHPEYFHIKKENIGLIEVMGLAILPGRLVKELKACGDYLLNQMKEGDEGLISSHLSWLEELKRKYKGLFDKKTISQVLNNEAGLVFEKVLECVGVFKDTAEGLEGFRKFIHTL